MLAVVSLEHVMMADTQLLSRRLKVLTGVLCGTCVAGCSFREHQRCLRDCHVVDTRVSLVCGLNISITPWLIIFPHWIGRPRWIRSDGESGFSTLSYVGSPIIRLLDRVRDNILRGLRRVDACIFESSGADKSELVNWLRRVGHGRSSRRVYGCCRDTHREHSVGRQGQLSIGARSFGWQRILGEAVAPTLGRYEEWLRFQAG